MLLMWNIYISGVCVASIIFSYMYGCECSKQDRNDTSMLVYFLALMMYGIISWAGVAFCLGVAITQYRRNQANIKSKEEIINTEH